MAEKKGEELYQNYAYTQTLKWEYNQYSAARQLHDTFDVMKNVIENKMKCNNYKLYVEFTEFGTVHYHGVLIHAEISKVLRNKHRLNEIGHNMFKPCNDYEGWMKYCTKNLQICKDVFPQITFPLDSKSVIRYKSTLHEIRDWGDYDNNIL